MIWSFTNLNRNGRGCAIFFKFVYLFTFFMDALDKNRNVIVFTFFLLLLFIGLFTYQQYGISWDESDSRDGNGLVNYNFIFHKHKQPLLDSSEKYHGPAFEILLVLIEQKLELTDLRYVYLMRHLVTYLFFYFSVLVFYFLCKNFFNSWKAGLAGALMLVLCPRIFADSFYNSKDIAFLSFFIFAMQAYFLFWKNRSLLYAILFALTTGILISIRVMGIIVPVFFMIALVVEWLTIKRRPFPFRNSIGYFILFPFFVVLTWPVLWLGAWHHFTEAFYQMSHFYWIGKVLFEGALIDAHHLPADYVPVWLLITVPDIFILLFATGMLFLFQRFIKHPLVISSHRLNYAIVLMWFFLPIISVVFFHSVIYDAWRHLFFIYPAFVIIAVFGLKVIYKKLMSYERLFKRKIVRVAVLSLVVIGFAEPALSTIKNYPFGNVYFNTTARLRFREMRKNFEMDYWGVSYRKGLEYILRCDTASSFRFYSTDEPCYLNLMLIERPQNERLVPVNKMGEADYFLTTCRSMSEPYAMKGEVFNVMSQGEKILFVYKLKHGD
ncbi:hypothetical protein BH11BAC1_BH11BAC1_08110 [soil metagenome]